MFFGEKKDSNGKIANFREDLFFEKRRKRGENNILDIIWITFILFQ